MEGIDPVDYNDNIMSLETFSKLLWESFHIITPQPTTVWCDNVALIQRVNKMKFWKQPSFVNETLLPSWDGRQSNKPPDIILTSPLLTF
jgi:hypothetical protein